MFSSERTLQCRNCEKLLDIGEPFLVSANYPTTNLFQIEAVTMNYLQSHGEVLCGDCATERLGIDSISKLKGAIFTKNQGKQHAIKKQTHSHETS